MSNQKLLTINFGGIGDEILFLPLLESIRSAYPDWKITLLLEPRSKSVEQVTNLIDEVLTFDIKKRPLTGNDLLHLVGILRDGNYDAVLSSGSSPVVALLLFLSGIRQRVGYHPTSGRFLLTNPVPLNRDQYAANMYHDLARGLNINVPAPPVRIQVPESCRLHMQSFLGHRQFQRRILLHPGTSALAIRKGIIKTWPGNCWAKLIDLLSNTPDTQVILAGGPDDGKTVGDILEQLSQETASTSSDSSYRFRCAYGHTRSLGDLAALIGLCDLLICVDSAPMHLAVGLNKPLLALFGPTKAEHLLPANPLFKALRSPPAGPELSSPEPSISGLRLTADVVYQAALNQLKLKGASNPESYPGYVH